MFLLADELFPLVREELRNASPRLSLIAHTTGISVWTSATALKPAQADRHDDEDYSNLLMTIS